MRACGGRGPRRRSAAPPPAYGSLPALTFDESSASFENAGPDAADLLCDILGRQSFPREEISRLTAKAAKVAEYSKADLNARVKVVLRQKRNEEKQVRIAAKGKPVINVIPGQLDETVAAADAALAAGNPTAVFQRGPDLVRVAASEAYDIEGCLVPASATVVTMSAADLRLRLRWLGLDFTCTWRNQPVRMICATPTASLRSVLLIIMDNSALARRA